MITILLVEDAYELAQVIMRELEASGYRVLHADNGLRALELHALVQPGLVVLDWMLPELDGLEVLRRLRQIAPTPVLMLTARGEETDKVVGLELGADDYVTKPFGWAELRARIRALLRRGEQTAAGVTSQVTAEAPPEGRVLVAGDLRIDVDRHEVQRGERQIELPARLFDLLVYLVRNKGLVLTRDRLLQHVWGYDYAGDTRTVDVHVRWLRERLEDDPARPVLVQTVRGVGYRFRG